METQAKGQTSSTDNNRARNVEMGRVKRRRTTSYNDMATTISGVTRCCSPLGSGVTNSLRYAQLGNSEHSHLRHKACTDEANL